LGYTKEQMAEWNKAPVGILRAVNRFVQGYDRLADGNLRNVTDRLNPLGVNILYFPFPTGVDSAHAGIVQGYPYIRDIIRVGSDLLNRTETSIARFMGGTVDGESRAVGSFAHEYTHLVDGSAELQLRVQYGQKVKGGMRLGVWKEYEQKGENIIYPNEFDLGEDIANTVGYYIAVGSGTLPSEAIGFINGLFKTYLKNGDIPQ
jgi:hypothetical protein